MKVESFRRKLIYEYQRRISNRDVGVLTPRTRKRKRYDKDPWDIRINTGIEKYSLVDYTLFL